MYSRLPQQIPNNKKDGGLSIEIPITTTKVTFAEYGIPCKLMSDAGTNFISEVQKVL